MISPKHSQHTVGNQHGYVLIVALFMLVILTAFGVFSLNTSLIEMQIAGNDKVQKQTFSQADGGTQVGSMLLEENIACPTGFSSVPLRIGGTLVHTKNFSNNEAIPRKPYPTDTRRHISLPNNDTEPHTNLFFSGKTIPATGMSSSLATGYEGPGRRQGGKLVTVINSQHLGQANSVSSLRATWQHIIFLEGTCSY